MEVKGCTNEIDITSMEVEKKIKINKASNSIFRYLAKSNNILNPYIILIILIITLFLFFAFFIKQFS